MNSQHAEFTFGPRHRQVVRTRGFPWARCVLSIATGLALAFMLFAAMGLVSPPAHAQQVKSMDAALASCAVFAFKADEITRLRDQGVPKRYALEWGYPASLVKAIYDDGVSRYRSAPRCYSLATIETLRELGYK